MDPALIWNEDKKRSGLFKKIAWAAATAAAIPWGKFEGMLKVSPLMTFYARKNASQTLASLPDEEG